MKISLNKLKEILGREDLPDHELTESLERVGIEVKRIHPSAQGASVTLEFLANRGDHHSYFGIAREASCVLDAKIATLVTIHPDGKLDPYDLRIESDQCLAISHFVLELKEHLPDLNQSICHVLGTSMDAGHGLAVDAANFVGLEIGQHLLCLDLDQVKGPLILKRSPEGAAGTILNENLPIAKDTLILVDDLGIVAIAGIVICDRARVSSRARRIWVGSGIFDPISIRKAAKALRISNEQSRRNERGADFGAVEGALCRYLAILSQHDSVECASKIVEEKLPITEKLTPKLIKIDKGEICEHLGVPLSETETLNHLTRRGFSIVAESKGKWTFAVPHFRYWDIESKFCLNEEVAIAIGYDNIPFALPADCIGAKPSDLEKLKEEFDRILIGAGFYEIQSDGFYGADLVKKMNLSDSSPLQDHIKTTNSIERGYSFLKNNAVFQCLEALQENRRFKVGTVKIFEWATIFKSAGGSIDEKKVFAGLASGQKIPSNWESKASEISFWYMKGLMQTLALRLSCESINVKACDTLAEADLFRKGAAFQLSVAGEEVGILAEIEQSILKRLKIDHASVFYFQLDQQVCEQLYAKKQRSNKKTILPSPILPIERMVSFHVPKMLHCGDITKTMQDFCPSIQRAFVADSYIDEKNDIRSFTFCLQFENSHEATVQAVNSAVESACDAVIGQYQTIGIARR